MKYIVPLLALVLTLMFSGCGSSNSSSEGPTPGEPTLQSIEVTPATSILPIGTTQKYQAIGIYSDDSQVDITDDVTWSLEKDEGIIVPVEDSLSYVRAEQAGEDKLVATLGGISFKANVSVTDEVVLVSFTITPQEADIQKGYREEFKAEGNYSNGYVVDLTDEATWTTGNTEIARMESHNWVGAHTVGDTTVTASFDSFDDSADISVYDVTHITHITVTPEEETYLIGDKRDYFVHVHLSDGRTDYVGNQASYYSNDLRVVKFNLVYQHWNELEALAEGDTTITAHYEGFDAEAVVNVEKYQIKSISIHPKNTTVRVKTTRQYLTDAVLVNPSDRLITISNSNSALHYSSDDEEIAFISNIESSKGQLTGRKAGTTTIHSFFKYEGEAFETNTTVIVTEN